MNIRGKEDPYLRIGEGLKRSEYKIEHHQKDEYIWALKNINLEIHQGEVLGIIGKNGAGKSTLLKILSKVTAPTTGSIKGRGRIASLLEVGTGFHPEMTGRENIFMNGSILGMTKQEIRMKFEEIVDFAGVEKFIDTPVKRYSSGMLVRLGFAVAAHLNPEILVVDEVLAVGDAEFQKKAIGKMQSISKGEGKTVLFVSHNLQSINKLCHNGIMLSKGGIDFFGPINDVISRYLSKDSNSYYQLLNRNITNSISLMGVVIVDGNNTLKKKLIVGESYILKLIIKISLEIQNTVFAIGITTLSDIPINTTWTVPQNLKPDTYEIEFISDQIYLQGGTYKISLGISKDNNILFYEENLFQFEVIIVSKEKKENLVNINGTTGLIYNQLRTRVNKYEFDNRFIKL